MAKAQDQIMRRTEIRTVLKRHKGSLSRVAESLDVRICTVSMVLRGRITSRRIMQACQIKALQLLEQERAEEQQRVNAIAAIHLA